LTNGLDTLLTSAVLGDVLGSVAQTQSMAHQAVTQDAAPVQAPVDQAVPTGTVSQLQNQGQSGVFNQQPLDNHVTLAAAATLGSNSTTLGGDGGITPLIPGNALYYGGDCSHVNGLANEYQSLVADAQTYDNFTVPDGQVWRVTGLFSHNYMSYQSN